MPLLCLRDVEPATAAPLEFNKDSGRGDRASRRPVTDDAGNAKVRWCRGDGLVAPLRRRPAAIGPSMSRTVNRLTDPPRSRALCWGDLSEKVASVLLAARCDLSVIPTEGAVRRFVGLENVVKRVLVDMLCSRSRSGRTLRTSQVRDLRFISQLHAPACCFA